jgi:hypothetical protein
MDKQQLLNTFKEETGKGYADIARDLGMGRGNVQKTLTGDRAINWTFYGKFQKAYRIAFPGWVEELHRLLSIEG